MTSLFKDEIKSGERVHNPTLAIKGVFKYPVASTLSGEWGKVISAMRVISDLMYT